MALQNVDFLAALDDNADGEDKENMAEDRLQQLGTWFEAKEDVIQRLTGRLRRAAAACTSSVYHVEI